MLLTRPHTTPARLRHQHLRMDAHTLLSWPPRLGGSYVSGCLVTCTPCVLCHPATDPPTAATVFCGLRTYRVVGLRLTCSHRCSMGAQVD